MDQFHFVNVSASRGSERRQFAEIGSSVFSSDVKTFMVKLGDGLGISVNVGGAQESCVGPQILQRDFILLLVCGAFILESKQLPLKCLWSVFLRI